MTLTPLLPTRSMFLSDSNPSPTVQFSSIAPYLAQSDSYSAATPPPVGELSSRFGERSRSTVFPTMPQPGDVFFGFRLVEELGHGTFARVFLAKQEALADREVALKVTLRPTREAERLARLQHTNVVPVYSVHTAAPLQVICMPYLGRRTIADVLVGYRKSQVAAGQSTRKALGTRKGSTALSGSRSRSGLPMRPMAPVKSEARPDVSPTASPMIGDGIAVLGILSQLAAGLAHAHARGILHLDLKPANVLLADTGEPMLLDFNLSFDAAETKRELVGGTIPYMAPEQLRDMQSRGKGQVDARTDLYSLGVMAFEMLTGKHPFPVTSRSLTDFDGLIAARERGPAPLRNHDVAISPAVEAIVRKLLAADPANRYQTAADLRDDIERQLNDRPLRFAPDRSIAERLGKWRRRNPRTLVAMFVAAVLAAAGGTGAFAFQESEKRAAGDAEAHARRTREELDVVRLDLVLPGDAKGRARGIERAGEILGEYGLPTDANWQSLPGFAKVPAAQRRGLAADLGELALLLAHANWIESLPGDRKEAAEKALAWNRVAERCFGDSPPPMLQRQRDELEAALGAEPVTRDLAKPANARDHFLDAVAAIGAGKTRSAIPPLKKAIGEQPSHGAAQFFLAYCKQQNGDFDRAVERYEAASVLMPSDPRPPFYCGIAHGLRLRYADAEDALAKALEIDPNFGLAYRNRGIARYELEKFREAESDFTLALANTTSPLQAYLLRSRSRDRLGDEAGAAADRRAAAALKPVTEYDFLVIGTIRVASAPKLALEDFRSAEKLNPNSLTAMINQASVLAEYLHDDKGALEPATRAVDRFPESALAHAQLALCLARLGRRNEAHREAERCYQLSKDKKVLYMIARTYAVMTRLHPDDRGRAITLLREAFNAGHYIASDYETERDLDPLRELPEFKKLLLAVKSLAI